MPSTFNIERRVGQSKGLRVLADRCSSVRPNIDTLLQLSLLRRNSLEELDSDEEY